MAKAQQHGDSEHEGKPWGHGRFAPHRQCCRRDKDNDSRPPGVRNQRKAD